MTILARKYARLADAQTALAALPGKLYLHEHAEGTGPDDYVITNPGNAAARIRARGVVTERPVEVLTAKDGKPCVPVPLVIGTRRVTGAAGSYDERTVTLGTDALAVPLAAVAAEPIEEPVLDEPKVEESKA